MFKCDCCGLCCCNLDKSSIYQDLDSGDGICKYFDENTRNEIIAKFCDNLTYGGFLLIGKTESVDRNLHNLEYIKPGIYRKKGEASGFKH